MRKRGGGGGMFINFNGFQLLFFGGKCQVMLQGREGGRWCGGGGGFIGAHSVVTRDHG